MNQEKENHMSKLTSLIRRAPKRFSAIAVMVAAAIIVPVAALAWGPDRPTYTVEKPANHVTFNSITNNPNYGDERNFVTIKDNANTGAGNWKDEISVANNKEYTVRMYVHNNAAANLNLVAQNVTANFNLPTYSAKRIQIDGYLNSSNATPTQIYDQAVFSSDANFSLKYVAGSAEYTNNVFTGGTALSDSVISSGATLGYDKLDGNIPGCFQYSGYVTFKVKAVTDNFDLQKTVRVNGAADKAFKETVAVKSGDKVDYQIYFKNSGGTPLKDVVIKDTLPKGVTYDAGTTYLHTSDGTKLVADGITAGGIIIGGFIPGGDAYIKFTATVKPTDAQLVCGPNTLRNVAKAVTTVGEQDDTADVTIDKTCAPVVKYTCDSLSVSRISRTEFKFTTAYTVQNATFKNVTYIIRDANGAEVERKTSTAKTLDYTRNTVGKYTVEAVITVTVDGQDKTISSADCKKEFDVPKTPQEYCPIPGKEHLPKDSKDCVETPVTPPVTPETPPELPHTGTSENILALVGLGSIIASISYYVASRRALNL